MGFKYKFSWIDVVCGMAFYIITESVFLTVTLTIAFVILIKIVCAMHEIERKFKTLDDK